MIDGTWRRIAGIHLQDDGTLAAVWLAQDPLADVTHLYDCAIFRIEIPVVIAEGLGARGRWIPIAWHKDAEEFSKELLNRGLNMLPEPCADSQAVAEIRSRDILQRMKTSRFRVDASAAEWLNEVRTFNREESKIPIEGYPLMAATRHAIEQLAYARPQSYGGSKKPNHPKVCIV